MYIYIYIIISFSILYYITILDQSFNDIRKMSVVQRRTEHGSYAFLVEYNNTDEEMYRRELNALQLLKGKYTSVNINKKK